MEESFSGFVVKRMRGFVNSLKIIFLNISNLVPERYLFCLLILSSITKSIKFSHSLKFTKVDA